MCTHPSLRAKCSRADNTELLTRGLSRQYTQTNSLENLNVLGFFECFTIWGHLCASQLFSSSCLTAHGVVFLCLVESPRFRVRFRENGNALMHESTVDSAVHA